mmetsp:Transcript_154509/g.495309  ORF Transcript_154509/g.495309 Transcript_154509/m.495309 type:complete len:180 (+) Transcript_154509:74-613(+)
MIKLPLPLPHLNQFDTRASDFASSHACNPCNVSPACHEGMASTACNRACIVRGGTHCTSCKPSPRHHEGNLCTSRNHASTFHARKPRCTWYNFVSVCHGGIHSMRCNTTSTCRVGSHYMSRTASSTCHGGNRCKLCKTSSIAHACMRDTQCNRALAFRVGTDEESQEIYLQAPRIAGWH